MSVTTKPATQAFALPFVAEAVVPNARALALVPPRRVLGKADGQSVLAAAVRALQTAQTDERRVVSGTSLEVRSAVPRKVADFIEGSHFNRFFPFGAGMTVAGAFVSLCIGVGNTHGPEPLFWGIFLGGTAACASITPLLAGVVALCRLPDKWRSKRMVELDDLKQPLKRLAASTGVERALIRSELEGLKHKLDGSRLLSPEAIEALEQATAPLNETTADATRALQHRALAQVMLAGISHSTVRAVESTLAACDPDERQGLALALKDAVFGDRKRVAAADYEARNNLHRVLNAAAQVSPAAHEAVTHAG